MTNKKRGKTEVYPFWYMEDIKDMMDYFKMKEMWHWYLVFCFGLLLGRRVSDTVNFKWSDFFYENGRMKDEIEITEQKTGKVSRPYVCGACKNAIKLYIEKTNINPMEHFDEFIIANGNKADLLKNRDNYSEEEFKELMWFETQATARAYRKQFKIAADACGISYPVSTHSTRKTFGYWSVKLHPYDITTIDKLQGIFEHRDRNTTLHYIGIAREDEIKLYNDMGDFITDVMEGKKPIIKNSPVLPLKSEDFRDILNKCWDMAQNGEDKCESILKLIGVAEEMMV